MKKLIIILGTIILGVFIVSTLIMGSKDSLKSGATEIIKDSNTRIEDMINDN